MSNIVDGLASAALDSIERSPLLKQYRSRISDRKNHTFIGNLESFKSSVYQGVKTQRSKGWSPTIKQDEELTQVITEYLSKMYSTLRADSISKVFSYSFIGGTPTDFKVLIAGDGLIFNHIKLLRQNAGISKVSATIKRLFNQTGKKIAVDVTHMESSTVAEQFATEMLVRFESRGNIPVSTAAIERLKATIKYNPLSTKIATISVEDGFGLTNQSTVTEAEITKLLAEAIGKDFIEKEAPNIIKPRVNKELNNLIDIAKKAGAKTSKKLPVDKGGTATKSKNLKRKPSKRGSTIVDGPDKFSLKQKQDWSNWSSLIRIINGKLPQQVAKNMGAPRLVYRTGRFANSTKVVGVDFTQKGNPTFEYDYSSKPYGIFERGSKSSLATPARDPKALVDKSIREIVKELAVDRFYTRRA
jgi:hypothetical protein